LSFVYVFIQLLNKIMYKKEINKILVTVKKRRLQLGYSQVFVAEKLYVTQNVYSKIESNKIKLTACRLSLICDIMEIDIVNLLRSV
jgi:transcriptional regulator with XRE-family HTH domain